MTADALADSGHQIRHRCPREGPNGAEFGGSQWMTPLRKSPAIRLADKNCLLSQMGQMAINNNNDNNKD